ncbi:MAG: hypothetical protein JXQ75_13790 [Phycisphaerae bacterium]|nr:hypothetical protein [Phycisphaerae bacterium]
MTTLNGDSTDEAIWKAWEDAAAYLATSSAELARQRITAGMILITRLPKRAASGAGASEEVEFDLRVIQDEIAAGRLKVCGDFSRPYGTDSLAGGSVPRTEGPGLLSCRPYGTEGVRCGVASTVIRGGAQLFAQVACGLEGEEAGECRLAPRGGGQEG